MVILNIIGGSEFSSNPDFGTNLKTAVEDLARANSVNLGRYDITYGDNSVNLSDLSNYATGNNDSEVLLTIQGDKG